ncbi:hypothetical protein YT1_4621 [Rhodococcus ruber]|nr:hypothetical protein YT1_4621 [Rhodococcus ruber]
MFARGSPSSVPGPTRPDVNSIRNNWVYNSFHVRSVVSVRDVGSVTDLLLL